MPITFDIMLALSFILIWALVADIKLCDRRNRRTPYREPLLEDKLFDGNRVENKKAA